MFRIIFVLIGAQSLFTVADLLARSNLSRNGFHFETLWTTWFISYFALRTLAMCGELYVFSHVDLGKTTALFGAVSILIANVLGVLVLGELISTVGYVAVVCATFAFLLLLWA